MALHGFVLENPMKNILVFMKIFTKCFVWCFWCSKWFKTLELCGVAFALKTCLKMVTGRLRPVRKIMHVANQRSVVTPIIEVCIRLGDLFI